jgi:hypothetical protein
MSTMKAFAKDDREKMRMTNTTGEPPDSDTHCCATEFFRRRRRLHRVRCELGRI